ncbi:hypothetical protein BC477_19625 [Clavibacter michiganensis subsp. michiganensis]|uniref:GH15-like domain-containing protein n=1 Tax=Clavibacter michiganensis subsp. michiganensis TaxID=33013 RepID=A0A251XCU9_CLAMM|nr:hypothetical protein BC477_19625 [Clavibacter michiganensis subsp. michiganensis]OUD99900.1 hypothetical protein CMMCAS07_19165 [Clavibacter michiganensis subsp. michiganensis]
MWLRDASLTLEVLLAHGFESEADEWRTWLLRAIAGDPGDVQIMYGLSGERYLPSATSRACPATTAPARCASATAPSSSTRPT